MTYFDVSTAADLQPIAAVVADIQRRAESLGISIMVVGAIARDILVRYQLGIDPARVTSDIDIAIAVASWAVDRRAPVPVADHAVAAEEQVAAV